MGKTARIVATLIYVGSLPLGLCGCAFLPGFSVLQDPALYFLDVQQVANQVACEVQTFMEEHEKDPVFRNQKWVLANDDVTVKLTLQTDSSGYVNFTGVNVAGLGLLSLQQFIATTASGKTTVSTLAAKPSAKRELASRIWTGR
jgi:hypothetical protein